MVERIEVYLQQTIFPDLERGRPGWDKPHTQAVVHFMKDIIKESPELHLDAPVLIAAAYAHDWGYADLFQAGKPVSYEGVNSAKTAHMAIGARKIAKLLNQTIFAELTESQKARIVHLVSVHDLLDTLKDTDELILMEADTMGALDVDRVKPTYDFASNERFITELKTRRFPLFITAFGKRHMAGLLQKRQRYYQQHL